MPPIGTLAAVAGGSGRTRITSAVGIHASGDHSHLWPVPKRRSRRYCSAVRPLGAVQLQLGLEGAVGVALPHLVLSRLLSRTSDTES